MSYLTVIVPFYNTEKYLPDCIKSLKEQTFKDFCCIMVDDNSSDNSRKICEEAVESDNRFIVIHNEKNLGSSKSREEALKLVKTEYVTFADSDDTIPPDAFEELVRVQKETGAKIVVGGRRYTDYEDNERSRISHVDNVDDVLKYYFELRGDTTPKGAGLWVLWAKAYKTQLFENIIFPEFSNGEDQCINIQICNKINGSDFAFTEKCVYTHRDNPNSLMHCVDREQNQTLKDSKEMIWREWEKQWLIDNNLYDKYEMDFIANVYLVGLGRFLILQNNPSKEDLQYIRSVYKQYKSKVKLTKKYALVLNFYYYVPLLAKLANKMRKIIKKIGGMKIII